MSIAKLLLIARTIPRLGIRNIGRIVLYRMLCKLGKGPVSIEPPMVPEGPFFTKELLPAPRLAAISFQGLKWFGWYSDDRATQGPPDWFYNPFTGAHFSNTYKPWHQLPDFSQDFGDIKCLWEQSRFQWCLGLAQLARSTGETHCIDTLNLWISDWLKNNPGYFGPNWKCGQEASIRIMHLYFASRLLGQNKRCPDPCRGLLSFIWSELNLPLFMRYRKIIITGQARQLHCSLVVAGFLEWDIILCRLSIGEQKDGVG
jgi:hypothetical protein